MRGQITKFKSDFWQLKLGYERITSDYCFAIIISNSFIIFFLTIIFHYIPHYRDVEYTIILLTNGYNFHSSEFAEQIKILLVFVNNI